MAQSEVGDKQVTPEQKIQQSIVTLRQFEVLCYLKSSGCMRSESDGSILRALQNKGIVQQHHNNNGCGGAFYTWTIRPEFVDSYFTVR